MATDGTAGPAITDWGRLQSARVRQVASPQTEEQLVNWCVMPDGTARRFLSAAWLIVPADNLSRRMPWICKIYDKYGCCPAVAEMKVTLQ